MKAMQLSRFGGPEALIPIDLPKPEPGPGEVVIRVASAGVNFAETLMRQDRYAITPPIPCVLGGEAAGVVEAAGEGVSSLKPGDRVAAALFATPAPLGGYAEYVRAPAYCVAPLPDAVSFDDACALMVQGLTALYLVRQASPAGKTVLIHAAAGGVGTFLTQLARQRGAKTVVAAASSPAKLKFAEDMGADAAIDYTRPDWTEALVTATGGVGPDLIYQSVGGDIARQSLAALAPLGQIVIYGALNIQDFNLGVPDLIGLIFKNQSLTGFAFTPLLNQASLQAGLSDLFGLTANGALKVHIGGRFALEDAAKAHAALESRATIGKVVLVA